MASRDLFSRSQHKYLRKMWFHLQSATLHYLMYNVEHAEEDGPVPEWLNDEVLARREEGYKHLITYAQMVSRFLPDSYSKLNLHTLVCRLGKQEIARGCVAKDNELWMERAVIYSVHIRV